VDLTDPTNARLAVASALEAAGIRAAVYGGLALAAYGEPRETKDADFAVFGTSAREAQAALEVEGGRPPPAVPGRRRRERSSPAACIPL